MQNWTSLDMPTLSGKLAVVTGATGGLGLETALELAGAKCDVILAGRNAAKGREAVARILARHSTAKVRFEKVDLSSLASIKDFADRLIAAGNPIHILVNNAGVMALPRRETTVDGFERQFGTNYLSHFALTAWLLPLLSAGRARVVQVSSIAHRGGKIWLDDLNFTQKYKPWPVYNQSKLAMLMFAIELDRRSRAHGWGLTSVAAHPGIASTQLMANGPMSRSNIVERWIGRVILSVLSHSVEAGTLPLLMAATKLDVEGGQYFGPQGWRENKGRPGLAKMEPQALDSAVAAELWVASEKLTDAPFSNEYAGETAI